MEDIIKAPIKSTIKTRMINKNQMHYIKKADEAKSKGMFKEAIDYYSKAGDHHGIEKVEEGFVRESGGRQTNLGIKIYLSAKREERFPVDISNNIEDYLKLDYPMWDSSQEN